MKVATHNGQFHADEVFAVATLRLLGLVTGPVIRTRDAEALEEADVVIDVGREYDPALGRFDHHQERELLVEGRPRAAFGLIWERFGKELCRERGISDKQFDRLDGTFVEAIDYSDIGKSQQSAAGVSWIIHRMNAVDAFGPENDTAFEKAVAFAEEVLEGLLREAEELDRADAVLTAASFDAVVEDRSYVLLEEYVDFFDFEFPEGLLYVVFPSGAGWRTQQIAEEVGSFVGRKPLPSSWAGLEPKEFLELLGSDEKATTDTFVHSALFICGTPSKETAIKAAIAAAKA